MEKVDYNSLYIKSKIGESETSNVYMLSDGSVLKIFSDISKLMYLMAGISLEQKIITATPIQNVEEILIPSKAVYNNDTFSGYISEYVEGKSFNEWEDELTLEQRTDLYMYGQMHSLVEGIVKRANGKKIIMPDLLTCDNIIITNDGKIRIIDYDGLQIGKYKAVSMSTALGDPDMYNIPKYMRSLLDFTHNLDKKSLIFLYFLTVFNINLLYVGQKHPATGRIITLDDIFNSLGLDDDDFKQKVWKVFQKECPNSFLGEDVFRLAEKYNMSVRKIEIAGQTQYIKKLVRK